MPYSYDIDAERPILWMKYSGKLNTDDYIASQQPVAAWLEGHSDLRVIVVDLSELTDFSPSVLPHARSSPAMIYDNSVIIVQGVGGLVRGVTTLFRQLSSRDIRVTSTSAETAAEIDRLFPPAS